MTKIIVQMGEREIQVDLTEELKIVVELE